MKENKILEKNLYEAAEMLRSNKRMINLTYAERVYLQQWIYEKTGNRISSRKCDLEEALKVFYEDKKPKEAPVNEELIDQILDNSRVSEVNEKQTAPSKKKKTVKNDCKEKTESDSEV